MFKSLWDLQSRMADYDNRLGIEQHVVLPQFSGWWSYLIEVELAVRMARSHNEALLCVMKKYPGRISGCCLVALQDVAGAIREMEWARENGFCSVVLDKVFPVKDHPYGEPLGSHRDLWPFFKRAEELSMPIYLHNVQHGHRISNLPLFQRDGLYVFAPEEGQMSLVSLFTVDCWMNIRGCNLFIPKQERRLLSHSSCGLIRSWRRLPSITPTRSNRWVTEMLTKVGEKLRRTRALHPAHIFLEKNRKPASHYFKNNFYFTIETEEPELPEAIEFLGAERFLFATDYPHDDPGGRMKFQDVELLKSNPKISESDKELIRWRNADRLFHAAR